MPAAMRGGSRGKAKPRAKTPPSSKSRPSVRTQGANAYAPAKLRAAQRVGLAPHHALMAATAVLTLALIATLATGQRAERASLAINSAIGSRFATVGFKLKAVRVQGASSLATADILKAAKVYKDQPLLGLDLELVRRDVQAVGWVKEARVVRLLPDTLVLQVVERRQLAVWQHGGVSQVIDELGRPSPEADARAFSRLPLIVGAGGNKNAAAILAAVSSRSRLSQRVEALVRVDGRRWDLRLKDGSLIQLPATGEEEALLQLEQIDLKSRLLELGFERIDLRDPTVVSVRPKGEVLPGQLVADGV